MLDRVFISSEHEEFSRMYLHSSKLELPIWDFKIRTFNHRQITSRITYFQNLIPMA